ncbi:serine hydrolase domain-containing protein [Micromonospora zhanjiangensis]|uniref:Serine hydrolase domain-containing protein n=1 Tax=Micromonospora zhanjiangensis TaxID=1522057 RepID=A0ABV8KS46_9ACTN
MRRSRRKILSAACSGLLAAALLATGGVPASAVTTDPAQRGGTLPKAELTAGLKRITDEGMAGVFAQARADRAVWNGASGVADLATDRPMRPDVRHRVGSITKTFTATALLQLVGERRVELDAPAARYLPDLAPAGVTVRMLMNHTSGIGSYDRVLFPDGYAVEKNRYVTFTPRQLARTGLDMPPTNAPGEKFAYSNTNYVLVGLIIEKVTGHDATAEITRRVIRPLGLRDTYFPGTSPRIAGPHSEGYVPWYDGTLADFAEYNMSWAWTAGALVSTADDLNRFYRALLGGRLLRPAQLREMQRTVPFDAAYPEAGGYGLALYWMPTRCGRAWGHDGLVFGYSTISWHSADGRRQMTLGENITHYAAPGQPNPILEATLDVVNTALCGPADAARTTAAPARVGTTVAPAPGAPTLIAPLPGQS